LGCCLFRLRRSAIRSKAKRARTVEDAHRQHTRTHLRDLRPDLPDEFVTIFERALDPDPRKRYQTAVPSKLALARFLGAPVET